MCSIGRISISLLELTVPTNSPYGLSQACSTKQLNKNKQYIYIASFCQTLSHEAGRFAMIPLRSVL